MHHGLTEEEINNHKTTVTLKSWHMCHFFSLKHSRSGAETMAYKKNGGLSHDKPPLSVLALR